MNSNLAESAVFHDLPWFAALVFGVLWSRICFIPNSASVLHSMFHYQSHFSFNHWPPLQTDERSSLPCCLSIDEHCGCVPTWCTARKSLRLMALSNRYRNRWEIVTSKSIRDHKSKHCTAGLQQRGLTTARRSKQSHQSTMPRRWGLEHEMRLKFNAWKGGRITRGLLKSMGNTRSKKKQDREEQIALNCRVPCLHGTRNIPQHLATLKCKTVQPNRTTRDCKSSQPVLKTFTCCKLASNLLLTCLLFRRQFTFCQLKTSVAPASWNQNLQDKANLFESNLNL